MKKIERRNGQIYLIDGENETLIEKFRFTSDGYLKIPENSSGRTLVKFSKIESLNDGEFYELKDKVEKVFSGNSENSGRISQKSLVEYMSEEDKIIYEEIMNRARRNYEEAHKKVELTPLEKARLKLKKAEELIRKLEAEAQG